MQNKKHKLSIKIFLRSRIKTFSLFILLLAAVPTVNPESPQNQSTAMELRGDIKGAIDTAKADYDKSKNPDSAIQLARLYYETGDFANAELILRKTIGDTATPSPKKAEALLILAHLYIATHRFDQADVILSSLVKLPSAKSDVYYAAVLLNIVSGKKQAAEDTLATLKIKYPDSPDTRLAESLLNGAYGRTQPYPPQGIFLPPNQQGDTIPEDISDKKYDNRSDKEQQATQKPSATAPPPKTEKDSHKVALQLGSFSKRQNAEKYASELKSKHKLATEIIEIDFADKKYYRVIIPVDSQEKAQHLLTSLKSKGLESFIIVY